MLTQPALEKSFRAYFEEIDRCIQGKCYWALLHLVVVLPDICGALEAPDGEATGTRYKEWCDRYLADSTINAEDWYAVRCVVLHQGRTITYRGQYNAYSFTQPNEDGGTQHRNVYRTEAGIHLSLDVGELANAVKTAMRRWFLDVERNTDSLKSANVAKNLLYLAQAKISTGQPIRVDFPVHQTWTTSSPWP